MAKILVVVDMQNDFLTGSLANESAVAIIPNIKREIESGYYDHIIFTRDTHKQDYLETQEGKRLPVAHCIEGTWGHEVCEELTRPAIKSGNHTSSFINKLTFGYNDWEEYYFYGPEDEITICGTCTDICVVSNALALKAAFPETTVRCIADCCAPLFGSEEKQNSAFSVMESCQVDVIR